MSWTSVRKELRCQATMSHPHRAVQTRGISQSNDALEALLQRTLQTAFWFFDHSVYTVSWEVRWLADRLGNVST